MPITIYLAGPDVFLPDAVRVGQVKVQACRQLGFDALFPLDPEFEGQGDAAAIFRANCALMDRADVGLCNLTPFRGVSADAGTVFELGFMFARGLPVYGYSGTPLSYRARVERLVGPLAGSPGRSVDREGLGVEDFGLADNLMITEAIAASGGSVVASASPPTTMVADLPAFDAFRDCLRALKTRFG